MPLVVMGVLALLVAAVVFRRRHSWRIDLADKGSVSEQWLAEHRATHPS
jgi:hypothetical protein